MMVYCNEFKFTDVVASISVTVGKCSKNLAPDDRDTGRLTCRAGGSPVMSLLYE